MSDWPALNSLAWLRLPCCNAEHPTRVEDEDDETISVAWPVAPHTEPVRAPGAEDGFFLGWVIERGAIEVPVTMVESDNGLLPLWKLTSIGPPVETQRRSFVRVSLDSNIGLHLIEGGAVTTARMLDLSEGGVRCDVDKWAIDPGKRLFNVEIEVKEETMFLPAQVAWWGNLEASGGRQIGLRFIELIPKTADNLRSFVFATQIEQRRKKLE